jgi:hypothetical protein
MIVTQEMVATLTDYRRVSAVCESCTVLKKQMVMTRASNKGSTFKLYYFCPADYEWGMTKLFHYRRGLPKGCGRFMEHVVLAKGRKRKRP